MEQGQQMRYTKEELELLKATFKDNEPLLKLLRKVFLPELDPSAPLGQMIDLWMTLNIDDMPVEQAMKNIKARNSLITHLDTQLIALQALANMKEETEEEKTKRLEKDSTK